jgi:hypothetical protein
VDSVGAGDARLLRDGLWAYEAEGMYQFGSFGAGNIRAWRGVVEASRGFAARWNPRVKIDFHVARGDRNRSLPGSRIAFGEDGHRLRKERRTNGNE